MREVVPRACDHRCAGGYRAHGLCFRRRLQKCSAPARRRSHAERERCVGRIIVAGEYSGPRTELSGVSACELEVGLPDPEAVVFPEHGKLTTQRCVCRDDRRDLFVSELDARGEVAWWKTLALGQPRAQLGVATGGQIVWGARLSMLPRPTGWHHRFGCWIARVRCVAAGRDALMLSGVYGNDLRVGDSALIGDARRSLHDVDIALGECQTGGLFPKRCGCPRAAEL